jgi:hypothetical protein
MVNESELEIYRQFVRTFYKTVYHLPEYATSQDWQRLMEPLLQVAADLLGDEEIARLEQEQPWSDEQRDDEAGMDLDASQQREHEVQHAPLYEEEGP